MRRLSLLVLLALSLLNAAPAGAQELPVATVADRVPIGAHGEWIAWSVRAGSRWRLTAARGGAVVVPPVPTRFKPFDVDLGTDAAGRTVAAYSRCRDEEYDRKARCRLYVLDLASGTERPIGIRRPAGASDRHPSMWKGRVLFARSDPRRNPRIDRVLLKVPGRRLRALPRGAMPKGCPYRTGCDRETREAWVTSMDLGDRLAAFGWTIVAPGVVGHAGLEVRAVRLRDRRSFLVGSGALGEACAGPGPDSILPQTPTVAGRSVWFSSVQTSCYRYRGHLDRAPVGGSWTGRRGRFEAIVLDAVPAGSGLVALVAPQQPTEDRQPCEAPEPPCEIRRIAKPELTQRTRKPRSPFF